MSWSVDTSHSSVGFSVRHMMVSRVSGEFQDFEAEVDLDPNNLEDSHVRAVIDTGSIDTGDDERDEHLRSDDFFAAGEYPSIEFESKEISSNGDGEFEVTGDLTIRDETRTVTLTGTQQGPAEDPWGGRVVGYSLEGEIDRGDFGLTWNQALETGGVLVGKEVSLEIDAEVTQQKEES